ncbi:hypothetical protein Nepgr_001040 [Nepenthes gracilis]|uniref:Uncharacterized protein n=1 Tax=Nepenthes gracilis TaxID=150966 RepID=A0AAD3P3R5_NEPGR|nr:hypothetical protein Nepgr_001040 [Nepenthes gracilis]
MIPTSYRSWHHVFRSARYFVKSGGFAWPSLLNTSASSLSGHVLASLALPPHGFHSGGSSKHQEHGEYVVPPLGSVVDDASMGTPVGMILQSPHRNVSNVPGFDAQLGLSVERGDEHKGLTWSSVVSKNLLGESAGLETADLDWNVLEFPV